MRWEFAVSFDEIEDMGFICSFLVGTLIPSFGKSPHLMQSNLKIERLLMPSPFSMIELRARGTATQDTWKRKKKKRKKEFSGTSLEHQWTLRTKTTPVDFKKILYMLLSHTPQYAALPHNCPPTSLLGLLQSSQEQTPP